MNTILGWFKSFHQWMVDKVWKPSWSKFVTWLYGIPSALVSIGMAAGTLAGDNHIQEFLAKVHVPDWVPVGLATIALIHYVASGRD